MNILFVTTYPLEYNTSANIRNIALIEGLLKLGHVVSTYSLYPEDARFFNKILSIGIKSRYWINKGGCYKKHFNSSVIQVECVCKEKSLLYL